MTEPHKAGDVIRIAHELVHGFRQEFVSGATLAGPMPDKLYRLTFYRDRMPAIVEKFEVTESTERAAAMKVVGNEPFSTFIREDVVTLMVSKEVLREIVQMSGRLPDTLATAAEDGAST